MAKMLLHTPEGVRDIYNYECEKKLFLQNKIHNLLKLYGYNDIQTPTFEFFDIFGKDKGSVPSKNMYKFFDREGNTLVLRPDITPSIARAVSKYFMDQDLPVKFCYMGNTFINTAEHQGKLKEVTQIGGELIGDNKSDADVEAIALVINSFLECGLDKFQIEIGHTGIFSGLIEVLGLDEDGADELKEFLDNRNYFAVEEFIKKLSIDKMTTDAILKLTGYNGSIDVLRMAKDTIKNEKIEMAIDRMEKVYEMLTFYGYEKYVSFDFANVGNHEYYTGIIFKGYTYGTGEAIATGGRYDNLLKLFGKDRPAMGFAINLDQLLIAMNRQKIEVELVTERILILYEGNNKKTAVNITMPLRAKGKYVTSLRKSSKYTLDEYKQFCISNNITKLIYIDGDSQITESVVEI